jgi:hypothetical protein
MIHADPYFGLGMGYSPVATEEWDGPATQRQAVVQLKAPVCPQRGCGREGVKARKLERNETDAWLCDRCWIWLVRPQSTKP